ncbi:MAG: hypothetical protein CMK59_08175 [Proteobacteria bacterium]|nr:hypothetical protein [Pseudomonadota bacterium]
MNYLISPTSTALLGLVACASLSLFHSSSAEELSFIEPLEEQVPSEGRCSLNIDENVYASMAGSNLSIEWDMAGETTSEVFVSIFTAQGRSYVLSTIVSNSGEHSIPLPETLDASQSYTIYIESATDKSRSMDCWDHAQLEILEPTCALNINRGLHVVTQDRVSIDWNMSGFKSDQVYLSIFLGSGDVYLLNTIEPNTGSYEWSVPKWIDSERVYSVYIEDAQNGSRGTNCWDHSELIVSSAS